MLIKYKIIELIKITDFLTSNSTNVANYGHQFQDIIAKLYSVGLGKLLLHLNSNFYMVP
jgi:hypothetical protein